MINKLGKLNQIQNHSKNRKVLDPYITFTEDLYVLLWQPIPWTLPDVQQVNLTLTPDPRTVLQFFTFKCAY